MQVSASCMGVSGLILQGYTMSETSTPKAESETPTSAVTESSIIQSDSSSLGSSVPYFSTTRKSTASKPTLKVGDEILGTSMVIATGDSENTVGGRDGTRPAPKVTFESGTGGFFGGFWMALVVVMFLMVLV
ncbi:hypothetical protein HDU67_000572 [Dinochytrium kinnereticum]|nr:hypothetical protein HDU67_000572 [Dinochytrium kinnereticum]